MQSLTQDQCFRAAMREYQEADKVAGCPQEWAWRMGRASAFACAAGLDVNGADARSHLAAIHRFEDQADAVTK